MWYSKPEYFTPNEAEQYVVDYLKTLTPVNINGHKIGKWLYYHGDDLSGFYGHPYCPFCMAFAPYKANGDWAVSPYCPNCGSRMEDVETNDG